MDDVTMHDSLSRHIACRDHLRVVEPHSSDSRALISLRGVSRLYDGGTITALKNVDLEIEAGDCVAIVGASGSGKSSFLRARKSVRFGSIQPPAASCQGPA